MSKFILVYLYKSGQILLEQKFSKVFKVGSFFTGQAGMVTKLFFLLGLINLVPRLFPLVEERPWSGLVR
jgi:hypothetical protein